MMRFYCLSLLLLSGCYSIQTGRIERRLTKGKTDSALKLSSKVRVRQKEKTHEIPAEALYQKALFSDIVADQSLPRLHFFINQFPENVNASKARLILLQWSMAEAESYASEAVFQGLAIQHRGRHEASGVSVRAEKEAYDSLKEQATTKELHTFLLRYPAGVFSEQVALMEADLSFMEAEAEDTVPAWRDFIRRYPDHGRRSEASSRLRGAAWREVSDSSTAELWSYAEEYSGSEEGWKAAVRALKLASWYQGDQTLTENVPISQATSQLVLSLGAPPAPGHQIDIRVDIQDGEEWITVPAWAQETAPLIGLESLSAESEEAFVKIRRDQLEWISPHPLCTPAKEALPIRLCSQMVYEDRSIETCLPLQITVPCHGARELVFLEHDDDLIGPVGHHIWNPGEASFEFLQPALSIPDEWTCTHVSGIDSYGAEVGCGRLAVRVGWEPGQQWIRRVDPSATMVERIDLVPVVTSKASPIKLNKAGDIYSKKRKLIRRAEGRRAVRAQSAPNRAFSPQHSGLPGAPPLLTVQEQPIVGTSLILPEGANILWTSPRTEHQSSIPEELLPFLGISNPRAGYAETFEAPIGPNGSPVRVHHVPTPDMSVFLIVTEEDPYAWQEMLFIPGQAGGPRSDWVLFQVGDSIYLRTMGTHSNGMTQTVTLRWSRGRFHLDAVAVGSGPP